MADALSDHDVHATPEQTRPKTAGKRCDVEIRHQHGDRYYTAVECKIGQNSIQKGAAVKDAQRWLKNADCWNAISLCYPADLSQDEPITPRRRIAASADLLMARVNQSGVVGNWRQGDLSDLAKLADDVGANETYRVTDILRRAIIEASDLIDTATAKDLAGALELPWAPARSGIDKRPPRIACLIIANMALLQNRMRSEGIRIPELDTLIDIRAARNRQMALSDNWKRIRSVDYAPVVDPALAVLHLLPADQHTHNLLGILIESVLDCVPYIRGLQLDHAGPLYHGLLETAKHDGSYYTSTSTSVLLAELAMPPDWSCIKDRWADADRLVNLKICDPSCGTGTLLMATARTLEQRFRQAGGDEEDLPALHLGLIEDVLYGLDINQHAIHLAASMLTLSAPGIDYNRMHLYSMQHGVNANGEVRAGSLDILVDDATYIPELAPPEIQQQRAVATGYREDTPDLNGRCDLVIMNPPFTRNDIRNRHLPPAVRRQVQKHEIQLAKSTPVRAHQDAIDQTTIGTFFTPIADILLDKNRGSLAIVKPFTACTNASGQSERNLLTDPSRFHLELVVTSHDNRRINFSENTDVHESLIIARRAGSAAKSNRRTAFVSLAENPQSASEAHFLAEAIQAALKGDRSALAHYGTIAWRPTKQLRERPWNATCFYDQSLAEAFDVLLDNTSLVPLGRVARVEPEGRRVRDAFQKADTRQNPDMRALWTHKSGRQTSMRTTSDEFLVSKGGRERYTNHLWQKRGNLLLANRVWLNLTHTPAVYLDQPALGSAFVPVTPVATDAEQASKAWCVWLNSTFGILAYLNFRQKKLTYPHFSLDGLRSLPVPRPRSCDLPTLVAAFDELADRALRPLPEIHSDPVRRSLDEAVVRAVPGLPRGLAPRLRQGISLEPSVTNEKEPFRLT